MPSVPMLFVVRSDWWISFAERYISVLWCLPGIEEFEWVLRADELPSKLKAFEQRPSLDFWKSDRPFLYAP